MSKLLIINGPNLNLLGEREQSQYGSITFDQLKKKCIDHSKKIGINALLFTRLTVLPKGKPTRFISLYFLSR